METNYLSTVQAKLKAPKNQRNNFGNYNYRSCEDILEALKPIINPDGYSIILSDEIVSIGERNYIKATATLTNGTNTFSTVGYAREEKEKKGMDGSQITGASSSYARKYALNGLFAIDDAKDSDTTNTHDKTEKTESKETDNRPWLSEKHFKQALDRIVAGESDVLKKLKEAFKMKKDYFSKLREAENDFKEENIINDDRPESDIPF